MESLTRIMMKLYVMRCYTLYYRHGSNHGASELGTGPFEMFKVYFFTRPIMQSLGYAQGLFLL